MKFYRCEHCGNVITHFVDSGVPVVCCGEPMKELTPNTTDAAVEKHVPVYTLDGNLVHVVVGEIKNPIKQLTPTDKPEAVFYIGEGDEVVAAYDYCNLHGLWKA